MTEDETLDRGKKGEVGEARFGCVRTRGIGRVSLRSLEEGLNKTLMNKITSRREQLEAIGRRVKVAEKEIRLEISFPPDGGPIKIRRKRISKKRTKSKPKQQNRARERKDREKSKRQSQSQPQEVALERASKTKPENLNCQNWGHPYPPNRPG
ncbi:hypothetical protein Tco_0003335, partial [Tanacetum coccineum]